MTRGTSRGTEAAQIDAAASALRTNSHHAISIRGIEKHYGSLRAIDGVSFDVEAGEFFGFLGPNGAGKTTTISALMGLVKLDAGRISLFGHDTVVDWRAARKLIGLAPQEYNFDRYLSIREILIFQAGYYGLCGREIHERADMLLERFSLTDKARDPFVKLSGGMKRRLTLARALIHSPKILILDEPTAGVDVELRLELWELLRELNGDGMTIFLTTHYLDEAESLCRRIGIIESGKLVALETTPRLLELAGETKLAVTVDRPIRSLPAELEVHKPKFTSGSRTVLFDEAKAVTLSHILFTLENAGWLIDDVTFVRPSLQDVFLSFTSSGNGSSAARRAEEHEAAADAALPYAEGTHLATAAPFGESADAFGNADDFDGDDAQTSRSGIVIENGRVMTDDDFEEPENPLQAAADPQHPFPGRYESGKHIRKSEHDA